MKTIYIMNETVTVSLDVKYNNFAYDFPLSKNRGITNFKILSDTSNIESIQLIIDDLVLVEQLYLYNFLKTDIQFDTLSNSRCLPTDKFSIKINGHTYNNDTITFSYDVVELSETNNEYLFNREEWHGTEILDNSLEHKIRLNFWRIEKLYAFLPENTVDARIIVDDKDNNIILTKENNYYIFNNKDNIDFFKYDNLYLKIVLSSSSNLYQVNLVNSFINTLKIYDHYVGIKYIV